MTFKKDGTDPSIPKQEQGRFAWSGGFSFGPLLAAMLGLPAPGQSNAQPEDHLRYRKSRRPERSRKLRPNMKLVSKRVRRKHRRARIAA